MNNGHHALHIRNIKFALASSPASSAPTRLAPGLCHEETDLMKKEGRKTMETFDEKDRRMGKWIIALLRGSVYAIALLLTLSQVTQIPTRTLYWVHVGCWVQLFICRHCFAQRWEPIKKKGILQGFLLHHPSIIQFTYSLYGRWPLLKST